MKRFLVFLLSTIARFMERLQHVWHAPFEEQPRWLVRTLSVLTFALAVATGIVVFLSCCAQAFVGNRPSNAAIERAKQAAERAAAAERNLHEFIMASHAFHLTGRPGGSYLNYEQNLSQPWHNYAWRPTYFSCPNAYGVDYDVPFGKFFGDDLLHVITTDIDKPVTVYKGDGGGWYFEPNGTLLKVFEVVYASPYVDFDGRHYVNCQSRVRYEYISLNRRRSFTPKGIEPVCGYRVGGEEPDACLWENPPQECAAGPSEFWSTEGQEALSFDGNNAVIKHPTGDYEVLQPGGSPLSRLLGSSFFSTSPRNAYVTAQFVSSSVTDRNGNVTQFIYDEQQRLSAVIDPLGRTTTYTRDADNKVSTITSRGVDGAVLAWTLDWSTFTFDPAVVLPDLECKNGLGERIPCQGFTYTTLTAITLPDRRQYRFSYTFPSSAPEDLRGQPGWGNLLEVSTPDGAVIRYEYGGPNVSVTVPPGYSRNCNFAAARSIYKRRQTSVETFPGGVLGPGNRTEIEHVVEPFPPSAERNCGRAYKIRQTFLSQLGEPLSIRQTIVCDDSWKLEGRTLAEEVLEPDGTVLEGVYSGDKTRGILWVDFETAIGRFPHDGPIALDVRPRKIQRVRNGQWSTETFSYEESDIPADNGRQRTLGNVVNHCFWQGDATSCTVGTGTKLVEKRTSYYHPVAYLARNLIRLPEEITVSAPGQGILSRTRYAYDETPVVRSTIPDGDPRLDRSVGTIRGNLTSVTSYTDAQASSGPVVTKTRYYDTGAVRATLSPRFSTQSFDSDYSTKYEYDFDACSPSHTERITTVTSPKSSPEGIALVTSTKSDCYTDLPLQVTDANEKITTYQYNRLGQMTATRYPDGGLVRYFYTNIAEDRAPSVTCSGQRVFNQATALPLRTAVCTKIRDGSPNPVEKLSLSTLDGLGRVIQTFSKDPEGDVTLDTQYDGMGRVWTVTNPYRTTSDPTMGWARTHYDALGRVTELKTYSGTVPANPNSVADCTAPNTPPGCGFTTGTITTTYEGNANTFVTTVTDQAGKVRRSLTDLLGRLVRVDEPNANGSLGDVTNPAQPTCYRYDALNNLREVKQGPWDQNARWCKAQGNDVQTRTFDYDSLSRLISATNPESGTIAYQYDANGNVTSKRDDRGIVTAIDYDALNRPKCKVYQYDDGRPHERTRNVAFAYDGLTSGNLALSCFGWQPSPPIAPPAGLQFNDTKGRLIGSLFPDDQSIKEFQTYDAMGRVTQNMQVVKDVQFRIGYEHDLAGNMTRITYPSGKVVKQVISAANRITDIASEGENYLTGIRYAPHGAIGSMTYAITTDPQLRETRVYNARLQPTQLLAQIGARDVMNFTYDFTRDGNNGNVYEITDQVQSGRRYIYDYDPLNRISSAQITRIEAQNYVYDRYGNMRINGVGSISTATNRIDGFGYDAMGNLERDDRQKYVYDAENRLVQVNNLSDQAIASYVYDTSGRRVMKSVSGEANDTLYVYHLGGHVLSEYEGPRDSIYGGDAEPASATAQVKYHLADHLGTPRVTLRADGTQVSRDDYWPFGAQIGGDRFEGGTHKFTGKERDQESGLDNFSARYYGSTFGRLMSPDDVRNDTHPSNPQSWNLYSYVRNNPLRFIDPTGLAAEVPFPEFKSPPELDNPVVEIREPSEASVSVQVVINFHSLEVVSKGPEALEITPAQIATTLDFFPFLYTIGRLIFERQLALKKINDDLGNSLGIPVHTEGGTVREDIEDFQHTVDYWFQARSPSEVQAGRAGPAAKVGLGIGLIAIVAAEVGHAFHELHQAELIGMGGELIRQIQGLQETYGRVLALQCPQGCFTKPLPRHEFHGWIRAPR